MEFWYPARVIAEFPARCGLPGVRLHAFAAPGELQLADAADDLLLPRRPGDSAGHLSACAVSDAGFGIGRISKRDFRELQRAPSEGGKALLTRLQFPQFVLVLEV